MSIACAKTTKNSISGSAGDCFPCFIYSFLTVLLRMIIKSYPLRRSLVRLALMVHKLGISRETLKQKERRCFARFS